MNKTLAFILAVAALLPLSSLSASTNVAGKYVRPDNPNVFMELKADGTWTMLSMSGTYVVSGDSIQLTMSGVKEGFAAKITEAGFVGPEGGAPWPKAGSSWSKSAAPAAPAQVPASIIGKYPDPEDPQGFVEFKADGTWSRNVRGSLDVSGTYVVSGDRIKLIVSGDKEELSAQITEAGFIGPRGGAPWPKAKASSSWSKSPAPAALAADLSSITGKYVDPANPKHYAELKADGTLTACVDREDEFMPYVVDGDSIKWLPGHKFEKTMRITKAGIIVDPEAGTPWPKVAAAAAPTPAPGNILGKYLLPGGSPESPDVVEIKADGTWTLTHGGEMQASGSYIAKGDVIAMLSRDDVMTAKFIANGLIMGGKGKVARKMTTTTSDGTPGPAAAPSRAESAAATAPTAVSAGIVGKYAMPGNSPPDQLEIKADGTWTLTEAGVVQHSGTYVIKGDSIVMTDPKETDTLAFKITANGIGINGHIIPKMTASTSGGTIAPVLPPLPEGIKRAAASPVGKFSVPGTTGFLELKADTTWIISTDGAVGMAGNYTVQGETVTLTSKDKTWPTSTFECTSAGLVGKSGNSLPRVK